jgi:hypothetical protein
MLSRISGSSRLRYGVVALTIPVMLAMPVAASAAVLGTASATSQVTYVNLAKATSLHNWQTDYSVKFQLRESSASIINADNSAVALTSGCHDCGAIAIGFQVVFAPAQSLTALNVDNTANATSYSCVRCSTLAEAYQLVDISNSQQHLTYDQVAGLEQVHFELEALQYSGLSTDQIQSKVAELANQALTILQNSAGAAPAGSAPSISPAINGSALPAQLTGNLRQDSERLNAAPVFTPIWAHLPAGQRRQVGQAGIKLAD